MRDTIKDIWGYLTETDKGRDFLSVLIAFLLGLLVGSIS